MPLRIELGSRNYLPWAVAFGLLAASLGACSGDEESNPAVGGSGVGATGATAGAGGTPAGGSSAGATGGSGGTSQGGSGGCGGLETEFLGQNNSALLTGTPFPEGTNDNADLVKVVSVAMSPAHPDFEVGDATVSRIAPSDEMALYIVIPVTNVSCRAYCFVGLDSEYLDSDGGTLEYPTLDIVNGSVGHVGTVYTSECLAPGETGYYTDTILFVAFDDLASVTASMRFDEEPSVDNPTARLIAQSYAFDPGTGLTVQVTNEGTDTAVVANSFSFYVLLDEQGAPLWWNDLKTPGETDATVNAGGSVTLSDPTVTFTGQGTQAIVFVSFEQP